MKYILYDPSNNQTLSNILRYVDYLGYSLEPEVVEINILDFPEYIKTTPSIITFNGQLYNGENECVHFLYEITNIMHLRDKSYSFIKEHPHYPKSLFKVKID